MKRKGYIYNDIASLENLSLADARASKGKSKQPGVIAHMKEQDANLWKLHCLLMDRKFATSAYTTFIIEEPKRREIFRLPYYPDRIVQHAVMNLLEPIFKAHFTADTYSCIKGKGIHAAVRKMKVVLQDIPGTTYCLKLDIKQFYPSVDHDILKALLRRKFKDPDLLSLLDGIIDSAPGLPIGNYLSQYFANFYLSGLDHWLKEIKSVKYYFRYADDLVILSGSKADLHQLLADIREYLANVLKLEVKGNYQVFPVATRGIDFLGYVFRHRYARMRKRIKKNMARAISRRKSRSTIAAYMGWASHCNSRNLIRTLTPT